MPTNSTSPRQCGSAVHARILLLVVLLHASVAGQYRADPDSTVYIMSPVTVRANRESDHQTLDTLKAKDLVNIPNLFSNVLSSVKILPGVTSNSELSSSYNVRGGNFDENLLYLNGFEIYQPYLVQQGIEQSQSIVNETMVSSMEFYHGAFPVHFGDKLSSALAVNYGSDERSELGGEAHADLFSMGLTLHDKTGGLSWMAAVRHAYPSLFDKTLQTAGMYKPSYDDIQVLGSYTLPDNAEIQVLALSARNKFESTPQSWFGNNQASRLIVRQVTLNFTGTSEYQFTTDLLGLKYISPISETSRLTTALSYHSDRESYNTDLAYRASYGGNVYYLPDSVKEIGRGSDVRDNAFLSERIEVTSDYTAAFNAHTIKAGVDVRYSKLESTLYEAASYRGADTIVITSKNADQHVKATMNSLSGYIEDNINLTGTLSANAGVRALKYYFNGEMLLSPRAELSFSPNASHSLHFSWGVYYQPPYFYEIRDKNPETAASLLAQKAVQYDLSWEYRFKQRSRLTSEAYYKNLTRLIPYTIDQQQLTYGSVNDHEGFAYGLDLQYEGELVKGMQTWIGYSYLNARERAVSGTGSYEDSPLDQSHTVRIFLQDHARLYPDFQVHVMLLFGSGYHYYPMVSVPGASPGSYQTVPDYSISYEYPFYFRVDMGMSYEFTIFGASRMTLSAEVLNVFDKNNVTSYSWFTVSQNSTRPMPIPNILSPRFFNAGFKFDL